MLSHDRGEVPARRFPGAIVDEQPQHGPAGLCGVLLAAGIMWAISLACVSGLTAIAITYWHTDKPGCEASR